MTGPRRLPPVHSPIAPLRALRALLPAGPWSPDRLEALLKERYQADAVILCDSGTHALQLGLAAVREDTGRDAAALPAYACYDLITAAVGARVRPYFYDVDPVRLDPDPQSLERALERRPGALVVVHHFGLPTDTAPLLEAAARGGVRVIEDAAQAHGGRLEGRRLGSLAPMSVLSFGRGKGWTGGEGGALLLRGEVAAEADRVSARLGPARGHAGTTVRLAAQWAFGRPALYAVPASLPGLALGETRYVPPTPAAPMTPSVARQVLAADPGAEAEIRTRRSHARQLRARLEGIPGIVLTPERGEPGYLRLPLRIQGVDAHRDLPSDAARWGVVPSYPRPLPALEVLDHDPTPFPGAERLSRELFTAPTHRFLRDRDVDAIVTMVGAVGKKHR